MFIVITDPDKGDIAYKLTIVSSVRGNCGNDPGVGDVVFISAARYEKVSLGDALQAGAEGKAVVLWVGGEEGEAGLPGYVVDIGRML